MANYFMRDLAVDTSGDIVISANGDIKLADSYESVKAAVNFLIKTDKGQYIPDKRLGCDLGTFVGEQMLTETFSLMEQTVRSNITKFILNPADIQIHVLPLDQNNAGVFLAVGGTYLDDTGTPMDYKTEMLTYIYPFMEGQPTLINIS
jgi:hypothetical protein